MRRRGAVVALVLIAIATGMSACTDDASSGEVTAELNTAAGSYPAGTPPKLTVVVHNDSPDPCSAPSHPIGSLIVQSVTRDQRGVASADRVVPTFAPPIDAVRAALRNIEPGESLALDVEVSRDPAAIVGHRIDENGAMTQSTWRVDEPGRYQVVASLEIPQGAATDGRPPLCHPDGGKAVHFTVTPH